MAVAAFLVAPNSAMLMPITSWADGGETKLSNLALLCRFHHRLVHEGGFGLAKLADGELQFTRPSGEVIPQAPETRSRGNASALIEENDQAGLNITSETTVPDWDGVRMDDDLAVSGLLQCRDGRMSISYLD